MDHLEQKQKGLDTDTNISIAEQIQIWLQTPLQIPWVNSNEKGVLSTQACLLPEDTIKMENTEKQDNLVNESHSSSSVSSCSCKSFLFHRNGTASGFIKIYELNHHWKYKTLVGAQEGMRRGGEREEAVVPAGEDEENGRKRRRRERTTTEKEMKGGRQTEGDRRIW